jgi:hypothetical protein
MLNSIGRTYDGVRLHAPAHAIKRCRVVGALRKSRAFQSPHFGAAVMRCGDAVTRWARLFGLPCHLARRPAVNGAVSASTALAEAFGKPTNEAASEERYHHKFNL